MPNIEKLMIRLLNNALAENTGRFITIPIPGTYWGNLKLGTSAFPVNGGEKTNRFRVYLLVDKSKTFYVDSEPKSLHITDGEILNEKFIFNPADVEKMQRISNMRPIEFSDVMADVVKKIIINGFEEIAFCFQTQVASYSFEQALNELYVKMRDLAFNNIHSVEDSKLDYITSHYSPPHDLIKNVFYEILGIIKALSDYVLQNDMPYDEKLIETYSLCVNVLKNTPQEDWMGNEIVISDIVNSLPKLNL